MARAWMVAATLMGGALACASAPGRQVPPAEMTFGTHDFVANLPGLEIRGRLAILRDTIMLEPHDVSCRPAVGTPSTEVIRYECHNVGEFLQVVILLDRRSPIQSSRWGATVIQRRLRRVCSLYRTNALGQVVCQRYSNEPYEETVGIGGRLNIIRPS